MRKYYSLSLGLALVYKPTDVFSLFLRYSYDFDEISHSNGIEVESKIIAGIEIPIGWNDSNNSK